MLLTLPKRRLTLHCQSIHLPSLETCLEEHMAGLGVGSDAAASTCHPPIVKPHFLQNYDRGMAKDLNIDWDNTVAHCNR